jgi:glycosyltransferase involved in cell wall biosynthesis
MNVVTVIPTYRDTLEQLSLSVESALRVTGMEGVLIVADGAPRIPREVLDRFGPDGRVRLLVLDKNRGCPAALNAGIAELADDSLVCRLDAGDEFFPEIKTRQVIELMIAAPSSCSFSAHHDSVTGATRMPYARMWARAIYSDNQFAASTTVFHKRVWFDVGGYDESLRYGDDWDFHMRVQHVVGWSPFWDVTCSAGELAGGLTDSARRDPVKRKLRDEHVARVHEQGRALSHPDLNKKWHEVNRVVRSYAS